MKKLFFSTLFLLFFYSINICSQNLEPVNSNYLIEHGVSPRVIDAAASSLLQDGSFIQDVTIKSNEGGVEKSYDLQVIYDPNYTDGMDVRMVYEDELLSEKEIKYLKTLVDNSHHFSRMSENYLYDESSLKLIKNEGDEVVFEFYYKKQDIEPYLKYVKKLKGNIVFKKGELDRIVLTNIKPIKKVQQLESTVYFKRTNKFGGHVISYVEKKYVIKDGKGTYNVQSTSTTSHYLNSEGEVLSWDGLEDVKPIFENKTTDTLAVKLGWVLPLLGKPATKLGYKLPRPIGLDAFVHNQNQKMEFTDLKVSLNDEPFVSFGDLFALENSSVDQGTFVSMIKVDVWILPFLNIMGIFGQGKNSVNGELKVAPELKGAIADWGWLIGVDPSDLPDVVEINIGLNSVMYGGGFTLAGGVGDWNLSLNYQLMFAKMVEANTTNVANIFTPMVGYMLPFGMNIMTGVQGQFYETKIEGFIDLASGDKLNYSVDFKPARWNLMFGIYKGFAKHWEIALQGGLGARNSLTAVFGYRF